MVEKKIKIFDKIRGKLSPILEIEDLSLKIYHPNVLSKETSLKIFDGQIHIDYLNDKLTEASDKLEKLREDSKLDEENLKDRKEVTNQVNELNNQIRDEIVSYIEALGKLPEGGLKIKIEHFYEDNADEDFDYPTDNLITDIFKEITQAIAEYREKELEISENEGTSQKK